MKKDKEWLKEELTKQIDILHTTISSGNYVKLVKRAEIMGLIDQLDEPELPVIPQFVADYVESKYGWTAFEIFYDIDDMNKLSEPISEWMYDNDEFENSKREILLLECIRGDYTIEKGKLYHVLDKNNNVMLKRKENGEITRVFSYVEISIYPEWQQDSLRLTEEEIKEYDERYLVFAKEVTEI